MSHPSTPNPAYLNHLEEETRRLATITETIPSPYVGAPPELASTVVAAVDALGGELNDVVHALHENPETAYQEHASVRTLAELLDRHGIEAEIGVHGIATSIRAEVSGRRRGARIAILSEYDALPEVGHACGHNVIAATGIGAFLALAKTVRADPDAFDGTVVFLGTPAEEGHSGKEVMAQNGAFEGIDAALMVHPYGYDLAEQVWLGRRLLTVTFTGIAAHASAQPFMGRNALDAASLAYQGLGLLRQQMLPVDRVHAILVDGGTRPSVIPEQAVMKFYARSKYPDTLKDLSQRMAEVVEGAARMAGVGVELEWDEHPPSLPVRGNDALTGRWVAAQRRRGREPLPAGVVSETLAASTDFGNVSYRIPGIHPLIKIAPPEVALHTRGFAAAAGSAAAESGALDGAAGLALTALDFLCDGQLRAAAAQEFEDRGGALDVPRYFD